MENNFCRRCGTKLKQITENYFECQNNHKIHDNPRPTVGIFILDEDKVILSVRGLDPGKGSLDSFGGFLDLHESFEDAVARELLEETQLNPDDYETPRYFCSAPSIYEYQGEDVPIASNFYITKLKPGKTIIPSDDVASIKILKIKDVDTNDIYNLDVKTAVKLLKKTNWSYNKNNE